MTDISLRAYNREIEEQINNGRYDEAIAHCKHILKFFPKHIHTYRLLGKAYLEAQRYSDAADVMQRVLSSCPDDFIAHIGMSIVREDEGNLDAALWHMERAYEMQPSNAAIQEELRRLYGRRDGQEPSKIQLTRGALAHMYAKGHLYAQAIAELQAALTEDPQRPDLQVLLAQMYYETGQRLEAAEICSTILKQLPYCLQANLIMANILSNTERADEANPYIERACAIEPYLAYRSSEISVIEQIPDTAIMLEHLEWIPGQEIEDIQPQFGWAQSLGIDVEPLKTKGEKVPDWLSTDLPKVKPFEGIDEEFLLEQRGLLEERGALEPNPEYKDETMKEVEMENPKLQEGSEPEEQIPEWLKPAGWAPAESPKEEAFNSSKGEADEELAPADIPEWLRSLAPSKTTEDKDASVAWLENLATRQQVPEDELLIQTEEGPETPTERLQVTIDKETALPSEVPQFIDQEALEPSASIGIADEMKETVPSDVPDWLSALGEEVTAREQDEEKETSLPKAEIPEWLKEIMNSQTSMQQEVQTEPIEQTQEPVWTLGDTQPMRISFEEKHFIERESKPIEVTPQESILKIKNEAILYESTGSEWIQPQEWKDKEKGEEAEIIHGVEATEEITAERPIPEWFSESEIGKSEEIVTPSTIEERLAEIPEWLQEFKKVETFDESVEELEITEEGIQVPQWLQTETTNKEAIEAIKEEIIQPIDINQASLSEIERVPGVGFILAQNIINHRDTYGPFKDLDELLNVYGIDTPTYNEIKHWFKIEEQIVQPPTSERTFESILKEARLNLESGEIEKAIEQYSMLIKQEQLIEEVIRDLEGALYQYPVDVPLYIALGDALVRNNRLQDALDIYGKAEELLR